MEVIEKREIGEVLRWLGLGRRLEVLEKREVGEVNKERWRFGILLGWLSMGRLAMERLAMERQLEFRRNIRKILQEERWTGIVLG